MEVPCSLSTATTEMEISYYLLNNYILQQMQREFQLHAASRQMRSEINSPAKKKQTNHTQSFHHDGKNADPTNQTDDKEREKRRNITTVPPVRVGAAPEHLPAPASGDASVHPLHRGCLRQDFPELHLGW